MPSLEGVKRVMNINQLIRQAARTRFINFAREIKHDLDIKPFHSVYYELLNRFAKGEIRKLIIQIPPQSGKSQGSTRFLPAFLLGLNPNLRIAIGSYSSTIARDFNLDIQRIIDSEEYRNIFPGTRLGGRPDNVPRTSEMCGIVGHEGFLRTIGRGGSLTSKTIDISILDDVYKDYMEGNSPVIREAAWKWYTSVVRTRLHNDSQELIVFTRWHEDDLIGRLEKTEPIINAESWADLENVGDAWVRINYEAIKEGPPSELDPRQRGEVLWEERHSLKQLQDYRSLDPMQFQCLYQGNPSSAQGRLYQSFKTYVEREEYGTFVRSGNYTDVADEGTDYLCSICYDIVKSQNEIYNEQTKRFEPLLFALVTDVVYTQESTDVTRISISSMLNVRGTQKAFIESNNGGAAFAREVGKRTRAIIEQFHQNTNKESRITSQASFVNAHIVMPVDWMVRFPLFGEHISSFLRNFSANKHDDAADCLTGIYEKEILHPSAKGYANGKKIFVH